MHILGAPHAADHTPGMDAYRAFPLKGAVGRHVQDRGLTVTLHVSEDLESFEATTDIEVTSPAQPWLGLVRLSDNAHIEWDCDYRAAFHGDPAALVDVIAPILRAAFTWTRSYPVTGQLAAVWAGCPPCSAIPSTPGIRCSAAAAGPPRPGRPVALVTGPRAPADHRPARRARPRRRRDHGSTRDGDDPNADRRPAHLRARSRVRCKLCQRRMCGITRTPAPRPPRRLRLLDLPVEPGQPAPRRAVPDHPRSRRPPGSAAGHAADGLAAYALAPGRAARLAELLPAGAAEAQARHDAQATALRLRIKQIDAAEHDLIAQLDDAAAMPAEAADLRARIRHQFVTLYGERGVTAQLDALDKDADRHGTDPALLDELPELAARLDELPDGSRPNCSPRSTSRSCGTRP